MLYLGGFIIHFTAAKLALLLWHGRHIIWNNEVPLGVAVGGVVLALLRPTPRAAAQDEGRGGLAARPVGCRRELHVRVGSSLSLPLPPLQWRQQGETTLRADFQVVLCTGLSITSTNYNFKVNVQKNWFKQFLTPVHKFFFIFLLLAATSDFFWILLTKFPLFWLWGGGVLIANFSFWFFRKNFLRGSGRPDHTFFGTLSQTAHFGCRYTRPPPGGPIYSAQRGW